MAGDQEEQRGVLAVDLGGTHLRVAVAHDGGQVTDRREVPTPQQDPAPAALVALAREVKASAVDPPVARAVVGIPGPVDYRRGRLEWAPHLPETWHTQLSEAHLGDALGVPVGVANDADLAAVGEAYFGAGTAYADVAYVTISTGVGAGVVLGGRLLHGQRSLAEVGHTVIDRRAFGAGGPATFELLASGTALARLAEEVGIAGGGPEVETLAAAGHRAARGVWEEVVLAIEVGLRNVIESFSPDVVVIGGGVGLSDDSLVATLGERLAADAPPGRRDPVEVVRAVLGDDAGLAGAAAWDRAFDPWAASRGG